MEQPLCSSTTITTLCISTCKMRYLKIKCLENLHSYRKCKLTIHIKSSRKSREPENKHKNKMSLKNNFVIFKLIITLVSEFLKISEIF